MKTRQKTETGNKQAIHLAPFRYVPCEQPSKNPRMNNPDRPISEVNPYSLIETFLSKLKNGKTKPPYHQATKHMHESIIQKPVKKQRKQYNSNGTFNTKELCSQGKSSKDSIGKKIDHKLQEIKKTPITVREKEVLPVRLNSLQSDNGTLVYSLKEEVKKTKKELKDVLREKKELSKAYEEYIEELKRDNKKNESHSDSRVKVDKLVKENRHLEKKLKENVVLSSITENDYRAKVQSLRKEKAALEQEVCMLKGQLNQESNGNSGLFEIQKQLKTAEKERDKYKEACEAFNNTIQQMAVDLEQLRKIEETSIQEKYEKDTKINELVTKNKIVRKRLESAYKEIEQFKSREKGKNDTINELEEYQYELNQLRQEVSHLRHKESENVVLLQKVKELERALRERSPRISVKRVNRVHKPKASIERSFSFKQSSSKKSKYSDVDLRQRLNGSRIKTTIFRPPSQTSFQQRSRRSMSNSFLHSQHSFHGRTSRLRVSSTYTSRPDSRREVTTRTFINGREVSPQSTQRSYINVDRQVDKKIEVLKHTLKENTYKRANLTPKRSLHRDKENNLNIDEYTYF